MNIEQLNTYKKFFTFSKQEFNFFSQKLQNKKYRFYNWNYLPPLYKCIINPYNKEGDLHRDFLIWEWLIWFKQKEVAADIKERFAENIEFQQKIMDQITMRVEDYKYFCGIIKAKTGMWKSHIIMDIIEYLQQPTLILVSNKKLMSEMIEKFTTLSNSKPWQYGDWKKELAGITIMTKSSFLKTRENELSDFTCVLVDELQTWFSPKFRTKFNTDFHNRDIYFYWLSATPSTNEFDQVDLEKYYGKTIEIKKEYDFIPDFTFFNYYSGKREEWEHYSELKQCLIDDIDRFNSQNDYLMENLSSKCSLILCDRLEEIERWETQLSDYFLTIKITWETKIEDDQRQLKEALKQDKPIIIIGSIQKTATGFDFPIIDTVFIFSSIKFENTGSESVGRAVRKYPWKTWASIYLWNDMPILNKQRLQKAKAIREEYWVNNITTININKDKWERNNISLTF